MLVQAIDLHHTTRQTDLSRVEPSIGAPLHDRDAFTRHLIDGDARVGRFEDDVCRRTGRVSVLLQSEGFLRSLILPCEAGFGKASSSLSPA